MVPSLPNTYPVQLIMDFGLCFLQIHNVPWTYSQHSTNNYHQPKIYVKNSNEKYYIQMRMTKIQTTDNKFWERCGATGTLLIENANELKSYIQTNNLHLMFKASLFRNTKTWKQPRCLLVDKWVNKLWLTYTMKYYSAIKWNETKLSKDIKELNACY